MKDDRWEAARLVPPIWTDNHPENIPMRVVVIVESMEGDGTAFHYLQSHDCHEWQALGLMEAGMTLIRDDLNRERHA